jgi:hypothetical protein
MNFSECLTIYDCITFNNKADINIIDYNLYKFIENTDIDDKYTPINNMKTLFNNKELFKQKLNDIINDENNINNLSEERKSLINEIIKFE